MKVWLRSLLFVAVFYVWSTVAVIVLFPVLLGPRSWTMRIMSIWAAGFTIFLRVICDVRVEVRGREHLAKGAALVAAKHQCMLDPLGALAIFPDACFVTKKELFLVPFFGWYCARAGMISVDRGGHSKALRQLMADVRRRIVDGRQLVIFPEGHRMAPGETGKYQPGVAALYKELGLPCMPLATNSGMHWPAHGFIRKPGLIVYEFLEPIPVGLPRAVFMRTLEDRIETASRALLPL